MYTKEEAIEKETTLGWKLAPDGDMFRRVVPSPQPQSILQIEQIKALLSAQDGMVICCGGGGVVRLPDRCLLPSAACCYLLP